jgi:hypothetical protein
MQEPSAGQLLLSLAPFALVTLICFFVAVPICRRKGRSLGIAFLCLIPFVTPFILFYFASLTDKQVLDRLSQLEAKLAEQSLRGS